MKIKNKNNDNIDIRDLYIKLLGENRNVFIQKIEDDIYIFRSIKRSEYRKIFLEEDFNDIEKEDIVCETCILYPENFNSDDADAGLPSKLCDLILKYSYMDSIDTQSKVMYAYRSEMIKIANQIDCIITEAFPKFSIEEVQDWDMDQTLKYLSRAEWSLKNLRGLNIDPDYFNFTPVTEEIENAEDLDKKEEDVIKKEPSKQARQKKQKLTPEKLAELKAKMPEIDWGHDSILEDGVKALEVREDITPPALRPGF